MTYGAQVATSHDASPHGWRRWVEPQPEMPPTPSGAHLFLRGLQPEALKQAAQVGLTAEWPVSADDKPRDIAEELLKSGRDPLTVLPPGLAGNFEPLLDQPPSPYLMLRTPYAS